MNKVEELVESTDISELTGNEWFFCMGTYGYNVAEFLNFQKKVGKAIIELFSNLESIGRILLSKDIFNEIFDVKTKDDLITVNTIAEKYPDKSKLKDMTIIDWFKKDSANNVFSGDLQKVVKKIDMMLFEFVH